LLLVVVSIVMPFCLDSAVQDPALKQPLLYQNYNKYKLKEEKANLAIDRTSDPLQDEQ